MADHLIRWLGPVGYVMGLDGAILLAYVIAIPANEIVVPTMLMLYMHLETQYAVRALKTGATCYLNKQSAPNQLVDAIRLVASGKKYISAEVAQELASQVSGERDGLPHESLSNREYQTLCMIASGLPVSAIAEKLVLSVKTISMYRARLLKKMQLKNNAELTHYAIKQGLLD